MCGLCGLIAERTDWTDTFTSEIPKRQARYKRLALINQIVKPYHVQVSDIQGLNYLVQNLTGKQAIANGLSELWEQIEDVTSRPLDVLNNDYLKQIKLELS
ncbi:MULTISPECIES: hypothetical protein [Moraxella]|uniref:hypothetical protein n=1 Tax=Moraxella TaxID=475 RepID=UPI0007E447FB|nr:hypothetical protein [Moraxella catarrhalis]STY82871.1 Uncharacterised protein [Moraxella catarrhalis]